MLYVTDNIGMFVCLMLLFMTLNIIVLKQYYITLLDGAFIAIAMLSIVIVDVIMLFCNDLMTEDEFYRNLILIYAYFITLWFLGKFFSKCLPALCFHFEITFFFYGLLERGNI